MGDNSQFMRNGDFHPTRLQAQQDAVNLITHSKTRSNPENNVALMTLSDLAVLVTLTTDTGKILAKLHQVNPVSELKFIPGIKIAHLCLKHRQGKNHKTRIVAFVGSPIEADEKEVIKLAKKLKKEKVNIDIVNFGEDASMEDETSEEAMLQRALAMSMDTGEAGSGAAPAPARDLSTMTEEEQIAYAMQMSMADAEKAEQTPDSMEVDEKDEDYSDVMNDPAFLTSVLQNLPGVDPQSEAVRKAVGEGAGKEEKEKEKKDEDKK